MQVPALFQAPRLRQELDAQVYFPEAEILAPCLDSWVDIAAVSSATSEEALTQDLWAQATTSPVKGMAKASMVQAMALAPAGDTVQKAVSGDP